MEGHLFRYTPQTGNMQPIEAFHNNSVKSLALDGEGNLLAGTDNGLYIYGNADGSLQHIVHDSRNIQSLTNNIIWNIFTDQEHNIWLGTDYGISLSRYNSAMQFIPISQITGTETGTSFTPCSGIQKDSTGSEALTESSGSTIPQATAMMPSGTEWETKNIRYPTTVSGTSTKTRSNSSG